MENLENNHTNNMSYLERNIKYISGAIGVAGLAATSLVAYRAFNSSEAKDLAERIFYAASVVGFGSIITSSIFGLTTMIASASSAHREDNN